MDERCEWVLGERESERGQQRWMRSVNGFCGRVRERGQDRWMRSVNGFCGRVREREDNRDG